MQFFKYYSVSPDAKPSEIFAPLKYHSIRYSSPASFNDLYDCKCLFEKSDGYKEDSLSQTINNHLRVACLTKHPQSPIMWTHYSSNNKGYAIEYEINDSNFLEIKYKDIKPFYLSSSQLRKEVLEKHGNISEIELDNHINHILLNDKKYMQKLMDAIFTKHIDWSYEKEYRFIDVDEKGFNKEFIDKKLEITQIKAILLGFKFNHKLYDRELKKIINSVYNGKIKVYKANPSLDKYEMFFSPYEF